MSELVTGDAVVLGLQPAKLPSRALAIMIDLALLWTAYLSLTLVLLTAMSGLDQAAGAAMAVGLLLLVLVGVPVAVETLSGGRSPGKVVCGLRVVREDGGPVRFRHALVRGAIGLVEIQLMLGVVAGLASLVSERGRRLGDVFAGTLVVRERTPVSRAAGPLRPHAPGAAEHFGGLDLSAVPEALWLAVRQYLMRSAQLTPEVSRSMARRLAADVAARTGAAVPEGMPAFVYLSGVLAERQDRDARRAFGTGGDATEGRPPVPPAAPDPYATGAGAGPAGTSGASAGGSWREPEPEHRPATGFVPPA